MSLFRPSFWCPFSVFAVATVPIADAPREMRDPQAGNEAAHASPEPVARQVRYGERLRTIR